MSVKTIHREDPGDKLSGHSRSQSPTFPRVERGPWERGCAIVVPRAFVSFGHVYAPPALLRLRNITLTPLAKTP